MKQFKDYYEVLGVHPQAPARAVEEAYWELAHQYHARRSRAAAKRLRLLNEAYEVLANPQRRLAYDRMWRQVNGREEPARRRLFSRLAGWLFRIPDRA